MLSANFDVFTTKGTSVYFLSHFRPTNGRWSAEKLTVKFYLASGVRNRKFYLAPNFSFQKFYLAPNYSFQKFYLAVKGLTRYVCWPFFHPSPDCTANKRLDLEAPNFSHKCTLTRYLYVPTTNFHPNSQRP